MEGEPKPVSWIDIVWVIVGASMMVASIAEGEALMSAAFGVPVGGLVACLAFQRANYVDWQASVASEDDDEC